MTTSWGEFAATQPELATFVAGRLLAAPSYLATVRADRTPRVHPVTPIVNDIGLYLFIEPTSPKAADLRDRGCFALHNGVPDNAGTGGEAAVSGVGRLISDDAVRATVVAAATYQPEDATCSSSCARRRCGAMATATWCCRSVGAGATTRNGVDRTAPSASNTRACPAARQFTVPGQ